MEELLLRGVFGRDELDVVDHKHIHAAVAGPKGRLGIAVDGCDKFIGEFLGGDIEDLRPWVRFPYELADGVEQMRFS